MNKALKESAFPGACVLVSLKGEIIFKKAWGYRALQPIREEMTTEDVFDVASLTKPLVTTFCTMDLVGNGKLTLDTSLWDLKQDISLFIPDQLRKITIKQLLLHSAGFMAYYPFFREHNVGVEKHEIYKRIMALPLSYEPGKRILYSDLGFILLEMIIIEVSKITLPQYLTNRLYKDISLNSTFLSDNSPKSDIEQRIVPTEYCNWRKKILRGIVHDENAYIMGGHSGHAGLFSTLTDIYSMTMKIRSFLKDLQLEHIFWKRYTAPDKSVRALGWDVPSGELPSCGRYFSDSTVGHLGFTGCSLWLDLEKDLLVVLLTNRVHPSRQNEKIRLFRPIIHDAIIEDLGIHGGQI